MIRDSEEQMTWTSKVLEIPKREGVFRIPFGHGLAVFKANWISFNDKRI